MPWFRKKSSQKGPQTTEQPLGPWTRPAAQSPYTAPPPTHQEKDKDQKVEIPKTQTEPDPRPRQRRWRAGEPLTPDTKLPTHQELSEEIARTKAELERVIGWPTELDTLGERSKQLLEESKKFRRDAMAARRRRERKMRVCLMTVVGVLVVVVGVGWQFGWL